MSAEHVVGMRMDGELPTYHQQEGFLDEHLLSFLEKRHLTSECGEGSARTIIQAYLAMCIPT